MIVQPHCPLILAQVLTMHLFARAERHLHVPRDNRASHIPKPKRADCFPPAVPQCIIMGSSKDSVHTAMRPSPAEFGSVLRTTSFSPWCVCAPAKTTDDTVSAHMFFVRAQAGGRLECRDICL